MEIKRDLLHKVLYSTDASAYRESPCGIFYPQTREELAEIVKFAREKGLPVIPRAAGTSLAGQVVGNGLVVDVSKHLNKILEINPKERWVRVEPGVILDDLNRYAANFGLFFGPETSTSNRCCMAGMAGNNSCGSHSLVYGSTRDHLLEAEVILSDGGTTRFRSVNKTGLRDMAESCKGVEKSIYEYVLKLINDTVACEEIGKNFPDKDVKRRNTGYALDELIKEGESVNLCSVLAGSEGTLAIITELKLALVPLPPTNRCVVCAHCSSLEDIFRANLVALEQSPSAVEMMDRNILELSKKNISQNKNRFFVKGDPAAILIVELARESREELEKAVIDTERALLESGFSYYCSKVYDKDISRVWELRKSGLGLLTSMKGDAKPVSVTEDTAVAPRYLPQYMKEFGGMMAKYKLECVYHAHIGTGELHLRPVLNLKKKGDVELFRKVAYESALLVKKYRGSLSGEHGDGRLRGEFIELLYGEYVYGLMKELKRVADPDNLFNPGKIISVPPMDTFLRYQPGAGTPDYKTLFDFAEYGGWLRAIEQCNGSGDCRKGNLAGGTMCPSYRVTGEEKDVTRGRANILRELLTRPLSTKVFDQKEIKEALDLCLSCKACKSECPSNVDMAKYKSEFLYQSYKVKGVPLRSYMVSVMNEFQRMGSLFPGIYNFFVSNKLISSVLKWILNFSKHRRIPLLSPQTLRGWYRKYRRELVGREFPNGIVCLFADEFTNYNDAHVGISFIRLLNKLGYRVIIPKHCESGRAAISKGMLKRARRLAIRNVTALKDLVSKDVPLVGIEPSAILSFRDEYPVLVSPELKDASVNISRNTFLYDEFITREISAGKIRSEQFSGKNLKIKLHGHCHQKSLASVEPSREMLSLPVNYQVYVIPSGCCGMAGSFGYEKEHYELSMEIGGQILFPEIKSADPNTIISAPGTSCRQQIQDGTGRKAYHPVEILYDALI
ncbi:MAG: FAD-linked oxidase C-terminal domain-containing protein [Bacteroidales bacterium]|nr:FAD-binding protein [Bacteroidales bacterium]MDD2425549.1 FAD-linked oxidase C-terminal domain-containing protein [Bacteroidales bacterium]MDD3990023.1 FAD-linked oxidase C-terminal domain-containing protein [Bacteroidales bacterium]